jgi:hypothetical protein
LRILAALVLFAGAASAQTVSKVELHACGVYERKVQSREDDAQSTSGKRTIVDHRLVEETLRVPARAGVSFGCQVTLQGTGEQAEFVAVLRLPRSQLSGSQAYRIGEPGYVGYTLRAAESGPWTLEVWVGERKLAEKTFTSE